MAKKLVGDNGTTKKIQKRIEREYHNKSKTKIKAEIPYTNDKLDGVLKTYHENGKLESETFYENGKKNGPEREYNKEGILKSEIHWKDNLNGFYLLCRYGTISYRYQYTRKETVYHWISLLSHYKNGKKDGLEEQSLRGILSKRIIYKKGVRIRSTAYKDGMKQGKEIWCDESGKPIRVMIYEKGVVTGIKGKDVSKLGPEYDYHSYPNEKYKSTLPFKKGVFLAHYSYHEGFDSASGGHLYSETPLEHGLAEGTAQCYYQICKRVQTITRYRSGIKDGLEQNFSRSGSLSTETPFTEGEKDGTEKRYPSHILPVCALRALIRGGPEKPKEALYFQKGIQAGVTEAELYSNEPFENDDYGDDDEDDD